MKTITSLLLLFCGFFVWIKWETGLYGSFEFRIDPMEDLVVSMIMLLCFGIPLFLGVRWLGRKLH